SGNYTADSLIISMGADARKLGIPGEREFTGRGVSFCATCDGAFYKEKEIHMVGGGDSAIEEALFLTRFARSITVIHRRDQLRAGAILEKRARENPKIHFIWDTVVKEVIGEETVKGLLIENINTGQQEIIPTDGVFISIGHTPNTGVLEGQIKLTKYGTIEIDDHMETSVKGVFAAGEIADPFFRQVVTSAGMGAAAAISATKYLATL
ncbi:MAG: FAD-dependent oxidoreductase, partial [Chloroflexi bacterium]|nr:FAD-dependent oxidoreductase [Chloroflexota bacterium]